MKILQAMAGAQYGGAEEFFVRLVLLLLLLILSSGKIVHRKSILELGSLMQSAFLTPMCRVVNRGL